MPDELGPLDVAALGSLGLRAENIGTLREGLYRTRNGRLVRLIGRYPHSWYGRFESCSSRSGKLPVGTYIWFLDGTSGSGRKPAWNLHARIVEAPAALMEALDRAHHIAVLDCDEYEVLAAEWAAVAEVEE